VFQFQIRKIFLREIHKTGDNVLSDQLFRFRDRSLLWDLNLEFAFAKTKIHYFFHASFIGRRCDGIVFSNLVAACYTQVYSSFTNEGGNVCCWEEYKGEREVLDKSNVQS
jgi:hypothetical protein